MTDFNFNGVPAELQEEIQEYIESELTGRGFLVCSEGGREEEVTDYIKESLWAFNASFLASETDIPQEVYEALQPRCEGANDAILKLVEKTCGLEEFVGSATSADGYGHFLSSYDGNEEEYQASDKEYYYIYRRD